MIRNDRFKLLFLCLLLTGALFPLFAADAAPDRVYRESNEKTTAAHRFRFEKKSDGAVIHLETESKGQIIRQVYDVDNRMATRSWKYSHPALNTEVSAFLHGDSIVLKGKDKGKPVDKSFEVDEAPWNQTFNIGLEPFAADSGGPEKTRFWAIGVGGPGNMKITKFKVKREGVETIIMEGKPVKALHISITLPGLLSIFWTGHYYYRVPDGRFLRYRGKNGPGEPVSIMDLIAEQETAPAIAK